MDKIMANHFSAQASGTINTSITFLLKCGETQSWGKFRFDKGLKCMDTNDLMMIDWDPTDGEVDDHYTIRSKGEVYQILEERVINHPDELWRVYETPSGGIHAFLLSHQVTPKQGGDLITEMRGDLLYRDHSIKRGMWGVRIGPKPNRIGDYVARYVATFGQGIALPEHIEAMKVHDSFLPNTPSPL